MNGYLSPAQAQLRPSTTPAPRPARRQKARLKALAQQHQQDCETCRYRQSPLAAEYPAVRCGKMAARAPGFSLLAMFTFSRQSQQEARRASAWRKRATVGRSTSSSKTPPKILTSNVCAQQQWCPAERAPPNQARFPPHDPAIAGPHATRREPTTQTPQPLTFVQSSTLSGAILTVLQPPWRGKQHHRRRPPRHGPSPRHSSCTMGFYRVTHSIPALARSTEQEIAEGCLPPPPPPSVSLACPSAHVRCRRRGQMQALCRACRFRCLV